MAVKGKGEIAQETFVLNSIGYVKSRYCHYNDIPHPHGKKRWTEDTSQIIFYPGHARKLEGLKGYSHIIVLYWIHKAREWKMPKGHGKPPKVKVFATRMPTRPNPIGLSVVELRTFSPKTGKITVKGLDALDKSPLLDIKPYIPNFDSLPKATLPDWVKKHLRKHHHIQDDDKKD